jgi:lipopolysaccharide export system protein LptA
MAAGGRGSNSQTGTRALRWVVAGTAVLLLLVVFGFVIAGKLTMKNYLHHLPGKLGVDIQQETNSFTYTQSSKGRRIFTLRASKEVQRKDGRIDLHEAEITLYGPTGAETDHIRGQDFEYDQKGQLLTAQGEVYIDLIAPAKESEAGGTDGGAKQRLIHVKTVGLIFNQREATASTDGEVEFRTDEYAGDAVGASYRSGDGVVVLNSDVHLSGLRVSPDGAQRPATLSAARAELDRQTNIIDLVQAHYVTLAEGGAQRFSAAHAVIHTATDGTPQRVDAAGDVLLATDARGQVSSQQMQMELGPNGQPRHAHFAGEVRYSSDENQARENGRADDAVVAFDEQGRARHALMNGSVSVVEQAPAAMRHLDAATLELTLAGGGKEPSVLRSAEAYGAGGAHLLLTEDAAKGRTSTEVKADRLTGRFDAGGAATELAGLDGTGHSWVQRIALNAAGVQQSKDTSTGDVLHVDFKPAGHGRSELTRAAQSGHVTTMHEAFAASGPKKGQAEVERGRSDDAVYEAAGELLRLSGNVEVQDDASALFADQVDVNRATGESVATGSVKVAYASEQIPGRPAQEPVHVLAAQGLAHKATGRAEFFAAAGGRVRMWQGTSQVEAPEIDLDQKQKGLVAHGSGTDALVVRTVLDSGRPAGVRGGGTVRVLSRALVYVDGARTVEFTGGVRVIDQDGTMNAQQATVWLSSSANQPQQAAGLMGGKVDHMIATGAVVLDQPGRRGTGEKLVYTASDGVFVLTGTPATPPKVVDQAEGTTTGAALKFRSGDNDVEVLGSLDEKKPGRVRTETRMTH